MVKKSLVAICFMFVLFHAAWGQSALRYIDSATTYGIQLELGPEDVAYGREVFAVYQFDSITDTLKLGEMPVNLGDQWPPDLRVTIYVRKYDSLAPQKLVVFDSLETAVSWTLPVLEPNTDDSLFKESSNGAILLFPRPINSVGVLRSKIRISIIWVVSKYYILPGPSKYYYSPTNLEREMRYTKETIDVLFGKPWLLPRD